MLLAGPNPFGTSSGTYPPDIKKGSGSPLFSFPLPSSFFFLPLAEPARPIQATIIHPLSTHSIYINQESDRAGLNHNLLLTPPKSVLQSVNPIPFHAHPALMATATVSPHCQVDGRRTPMTRSARCRCPNVAACEVHVAAYATATVRDHSEIPMSTRCTSRGIQRVPKRKRQPKAVASIISTVGIETHMEQIRLQSPQSQNSPLKPSNGVWPTELKTFPSNRWENVDAAEGRFCLLGQSNHQEINCASQGHCSPAFREDFVLFDEVPRHQSTLDRLDKGHPDDEDENMMMKSIESADRTEGDLEDNPHLRLPPRPRPTRLPTPDFDDEIAATFFPPLDTVGNKPQRRLVAGKCGDTKPLLIPFANGNLSQLRFGKETTLRSFPGKRPRLVIPQQGQHISSPRRNRVPNSNP